LFLIFISGQTTMPCEYSCLF